VENMINFTKGEELALRKVGGVLSFSFGSTCRLPLSCQFLGFVVFSFYMTFLESFFGFGSFNYA
jgi:hypothetical protein